MKHYAKKQIPAREKKVLDKITCDLCGKSAKHGGLEVFTWGVNEAKIEGTKYVADICPDCFKNKLFPLLSSQGCTAKREDWDY